MGREPKVAVITGASQGIGAALVKAYRECNYMVVATARSIKPSDEHDVLAIPGDITDRNTAGRTISEGMARFGRIDTLVNNAGIFISKPFIQYTEADFAAILGVNVAGFFHITQLAVAEMGKQGSGHVVQITTSLDEHAMAGVPSVLAALTKGGLNAATKSLAIEYAKRQAPSRPRCIPLRRIHSPGREQSALALDSTCENIPVERPTSALSPRRLTPKAVHGWSKLAPNLVIVERSRHSHARVRSVWKAP